MAQCHGTLGANVLDGDTLVYQVSDTGEASQATIVRDTGALSGEELQAKKTW